MMLGGLALAHLAGLMAAMAALVLAGSSGLVSAVIGLAVVVIFYSIGQAIEIIALELPGFTGLSIVLASYAVRVIGIGFLIWAVLTAGRGVLSEGWVVAGVVAAVLGWTTGVVVVAARQRVPVFDHDYQPPERRPDGQ